MNRLQQLLPFIALLCAGTSLFAVDVPPNRLSCATNPTYEARSVEGSQTPHVKKLPKKNILKQALQNEDSRAAVGTFFLILGFLLSIITATFVVGLVLLLFSTPNPLLVLVFFGIGGYIVCVQIFKAAYKRLMPNLKKRTRALWAGFSPLLSMILATFLILSLLVLG